MDRINGRPCYCSIGAGGTPCIDRKYCDALREIERLRMEFVESCKGQQEIEKRLQKQIIATEGQRDTYRIAYERLRAALDRIVNVTDKDDWAGQYAREALHDE